MKHLHLPSLMMHILLLVMARLTINDYPDFFLFTALAVLSAHLIFTILSKKNLLIPGCVGICLYFLAGCFHFVTPASGAFGLGGGGFAWFFYGVALAVSVALQCILFLLRRLKSR